VTVKDCQECPYYASEVQKVVIPRKLLLCSSPHMGGNAPGDNVVMTAAVQMLHEQHRGLYLTAVETPSPDVWLNNPHIQPLDSSMESAERVLMTYPLIHRSNQRPIHFLQAYVDFLSRFLEIKLELTVNRPSLYVAEPELAVRIREVPERFWLVNAGVGRLTAKAWGHERYQAVVDALKDETSFVQVGLDRDNHKPLNGVVNLIGKTTEREMILLAYRSQGGLGPTTFLSHVMAAFQKPYVCLLGGREPVSWTHYPTQVTLGGTGTLPCCRYGACWRSYALASEGNQDDPLHGDACERPVGNVPQCLADIEPGQVVTAIRRSLVFSG